MAAPTRKTVVPTPPSMMMPKIRMLMSPAVPEEAVGTAMAPTLKTVVVPPPPRMIMPKKRMTQEPTRKTVVVPAPPTPLMMMSLSAMMTSPSSQEVPPQAAVERLLVSTWSGAPVEAACWPATAANSVEDPWAVEAGAGLPTMSPCLSQVHLPCRRRLTSASSLSSAALRGLPPPCPPQRLCCLPWRLPCCPRRLPWRRPSRPATATACCDGDGDQDDAGPVVVPMLLPCLPQVHLCRHSRVLRSLHSRVLRSRPRSRAALVRG